MTKERRKRTIQLIVMIALPLAVGLISSLVSSDAMREFAFMNKPDFAPSAWVFPVVWTLLYVLMGYASFRVVVSETSDRIKTHALFLYFIQLALNFFWPVIFFNMHEYLFAFFWIIILGAVLVLCIMNFMKADRTAGLMLVPYLGWLVFAAVLNMAIYIMYITPLPLVF